ncbi:MAG: NAD(P)/FAD-dependent oxidoreductase [Candidatus Cyclobacteriaceae bacterium M2_1C_046]
MQKFDYIISGAGIAGVTLAHQLLKRNKKIILFDAGENYSSRVAAGLYNPITGRKMVKTWKADLLFSYLVDFYKEIEENVNAHFLIETPIYRPFVSIEEQNDWLGKSSDKSFAKLIRKVYTKSQFSGCFNDPFGGIELNYSGWMDISQYLNKSIRSFKENPLIQVVEEKLDINELIIEEHGIVFGNINSDKIIFCEGIDLKSNHFFNWLPLQLLKGEILEIELPFEIKRIFNRGIFVLPIEGKKYRVGSTYVHNDLSMTVTEEGRQQLEDKLLGLVQTDYVITDQKAGLRPTTKDRRPFLGQHPEYKNLFVFNGLGTKGVSLAPYFANHLVEYLEEGKDLIDEVNIKRFLSLYY